MTNNSFIFNFKIHLFIIFFNGQIELPKNHAPL